MSLSLSRMTAVKHLSSEIFAFVSFLKVQVSYADAKNAAWGCLGENTGWGWVGGVLALGLTLLCMPSLLQQVQACLKSQILPPGSL